MTLAKLLPLGQEIFEKRYAYPGEKTWGERAKVISKTIASAEKDEDKERVFESFYEVIGAGDFIPGGRIIFGSGRNNGKQSLLNCFALTPGDSVESIGKLISDAYKISCAGGGIGFNFSKIRPRGDDIQNIKNSAPGSVSVIKMVNEIGHHVKSGGGRRTALIAVLDVSHPDILEFLHVKLNKGELTNFNISVGITKRFIEAVENDEQWYFTFGNRKYFTYSVERTLKDGSSERIQVIALDEQDAVDRASLHCKISWEDTFSNPKKEIFLARTLWDLIYTNSVEAGCPGIYNIDLANSYTNVSYFEPELLQPNPCGEICLPAYGNCCLGHVNLANMVENGDVDWKRLAKAIRAGIRFLDNVLTINNFPTPECREVGHRSRRIGLGVTGLAHMLIKLGYKYGTEKSLEFMDRLFSTIRDEAYKTSVYLARDKGVFPAFNSKLYLEEVFAKTLPARIRMLIKEHGIRNAVMLTNAPCGTISMVHGVSTGIEPIFAAMYLRRWRDANVWKEQVVVDPLFQEVYDSGDKNRMETFVGSYDVTPEEHMKVQATIQRYIDSAISKTINLPSTAQAKDVAELALKYAPYLKGMTIYRASSKEGEPLTHIPLTEENINKYMKNKNESNVADGAACSLNGGDCS